jgi:TolA-binding protein
MTRHQTHRFPTERAAVLLSLWLSLPASALWAGRKATSPLKDPTRAFTFEFPADNPSEALRRQLDFVRKTSPGLDGLHTQYMIAEILMEREDWIGAAQVLQQLAAVPLSDDFFNLSVLQKLGDVYMRMGKYKEAAKSYEDVSQGSVKALLPEAILGRCFAALALGDRDKATLHFQELTAFHSNYRALKRLQLPLGMILWEMGRYGEALDFFKKDEKNPAALYYMGLCQRALKKPSEAVACFRAIQQDPGAGDWATRAEFEMGETFYQQNDFPLAGKTFEGLAQKNPKGSWHTLALYRLACADFQSKRYAEAERKFRTLYDEGATNILLPNVIYLLSEALAQQNRIAPIVKLLQDQAKAGQAGGDSAFRLIWALTAMGRYSEAVSLANDYLNAEWDPELTPKTLLVQGWAYEKSGQVPEALATYHMVVEHFPATAHAARAVELLAMNYFRTGQYPPVITEVRHLWNTLPPDLQKKHPETLFWIGEVHLALKNSAEAIRFYQQFADAAPASHPLMIPAYRGMAVAAAQNRDFAQSAKYLGRAAEAAQEAKDEALAATLQLDLADAQFDAKSYESAASAYRQFQKLAPKDARIPFSLFEEGLALHRSEYYTDAVAAWDKLATTYPKDPKAPEALMRLAKTQFDMGKSTEAVSGYERFLKSYPRDPQAKDARLQIGQCYYNAGNYLKAIEAYDHFLRMYPKDEQATMVTQLLQTCYYQMKMSPEEIEKRTAGQAKTGVLADIYWEEAAKLYNEKKYDKALAYFQKILFEFPAASVASQASFYRAESLFLLEKYSDAVPAFGNFLQYYPDDPAKSQAMFHLAVGLFNEKEYAKAAAAFRDFAKGFPDDPLAKNAALNAGVCYAKAADVDGAVEAYLKYAATYPEAEDLGAVYLQLGDFLEKENQLDKAADAYSRVPANRPEYAQGLYQAAEVHRKRNDEASQRQAYETLRRAPTRNDPFRIAGLLQLAELDVAKNDFKGAKALYEDVAANAQDEQSVALAKEQLKVLQTANP